MILQNISLVAAFAMLAACSNEKPTVEQAQGNSGAKSSAPAATTPAAVNGVRAENDNPALAVEAEGLRLFDKQSGSARAIPFGTPRDDVLKMLAFHGKPKTGTNGECGAGPLDFANWSDGLGLFFQDGKFVGWNLNASGNIAITTASGIGIGSSRADLDSAYVAQITETTLGTEFAAGELFGLLDGKGRSAKITNMWGGVSCNFR